MGLFVRMLVMKDSILLFTFNSRSTLQILDLQIVAKAFSISRNTAATYSLLRKTSHIFKVR